MQPGEHSKPVRVCIHITIMADTVRPKVLAENLGCQVRHMMSWQPESAVGGRAVAFLSDWQEVSPEMEEIGRRGAEGIMDAMNAPSPTKSLFKVKSKGGHRGK